MTAIMSQQEAVSFEGTLKSVRCHYPDKDGWGVFVIADAAGGGDHCVTGNLTKPVPGETLKVKGVWREHQSYGRQVMAKSIVPSLPTSESGIIRLLKTFPSIGQKRAEKLYLRYGADVLSVISKDSWALGHLKGIRQSDIDAIRESIVDRQESLDAEQEMAELGIGPRTKTKIIEKFGDKTLSVLANSPYDLVKVSGVGFLSIDKSLLTRRRTEITDIHRICAAINYLLQYAAENDGHSYLPIPELLELRDRAGIDFGPTDDDRFNEAVDLAVEKGLIVKIDEGLALPRLDEAERGIATYFRQAGLHPVDPITNPIGDGNLTPEQQQAVRNVFNSRFSVLTGGPGTGKTTTLREVIAHFPHRNIKQAALSGQAALKMKESTGVAASTIHALIHDLEQGFVVDLDLMILDEFSMVPIDLMWELICAIEGAGFEPRIMIVGDADQIPSIGAGRLLGELIESDFFPTIHLSKVHRQAQGSLIITNAQRVRHGQYITAEHPCQTEGIDLRNDCFISHLQDEDKIKKLIENAYSDRIPKLIKRNGEAVNPRHDVLLICPQKTGALGVRNLNLILQDLLNPRGDHDPYILIKKGNAQFEVRYGDRVLVTKNLERRFLVNGDIGTVTNISAKSFTARFAGDRTYEFKPDKFSVIELGYSITIHKSQGSQAPMVIVLMHTAAPMMRQRNLFYTAITRPEDFLWVIGKPNLIQQCIENQTPRYRMTRLKSLLTNVPV